MTRSLFTLLLLLAGALATAQVVHVPVPADDSAASETLRQILGLDQDQPIRPVTGPTFPIVQYEVEFTTTDGVVIRGDYSHTPIDPKAPVVILIHDMRGNRQEFGDFPRFLLENGYSVLSYDTRGHGQSVRRADGTMIMEADEARKDARRYYNDMLKDVDGALTWLESNGLVKEGGVYLAGRRVGGIVAGVALVRNALRVRGGIFESPSVGILDLNLANAMGEIQGRPVLVVTSSTDDTAAGALRGFRAKNPSVIAAVITGVPARENLMLNLEAREEILKFLP